MKRTRNNKHNLLIIYFILLRLTNVCAQSNTKDTVQNKLIDKYMTAPIPPDTMGVFGVVQESPKLLNGNMNKYFNENTIPSSANTRGKNWVRKVWLSFVVEKNGSVSTITVMRTTDTTLNKEAIRIVAASQWMPGKQNGKAVRVQLLKPVSFKISVTSADSAMKK